MGRMWLGAMCVAAGSFAIAGCRYETVWAGVRLSDDGSTIVVAAQEPLCGCLTLRNKGSAPVRLTVRLHSQTVGESTLDAGKQGEWRFDWAGSSNDDTYEIFGTTERGEDVVLRDHLDMGAMTRWTDCAQAACAYGDLLMNMADVGR